MTKVPAIIAMVVGLAVGPATAQNTTRPAKTVATPDCTALWKSADKNSDANLVGTEADKYKSVMTKVDTDKDGKISQTEFTSACQRGDIKS